MGSSQSKTRQKKDWQRAISDIGSSVYIDDYSDTKSDYSDAKTDYSDNNSDYSDSKSDDISDWSIDSGSSYKSSSNYEWMDNSKQFRSGLPPNCKILDDLESSISCSSDQTIRYVSPKSKSVRSLRSYEFQTKPKNMGKYMYCRQGYILEPSRQKCVKRKRQLYSDY